MSKLRSYAPPFVKKMVWDWKHRTNHIDPVGCPHEVLDCLSTLEPNATVLDLGCGTGNLRAALRLRGWKGHFVGVDVADKAIELAKGSGDANAEWHVSTIEEFHVPAQKVDAVCLCESIYYVKPQAVPALLERCRQSLLPHGRIFIRIIHTDRHPEYIELLEEMGAVPKPPMYVLQ